MKIAGLYAILNLPHAAGLEPAAVLEAMLAGGARVVQLRSKRAPLDPGVVRSLAAHTRAASIPLIINDDLELARSLAQANAGVAGVHLGQGDLQRLGASPTQRRATREHLRELGLILGVSTHDLDQVRRALDELDPDYLGYGPVFPTPTKQDPEPVVGLEGLAEACRVTEARRRAVPVVGIGGIDGERASAVIEGGAAAVAVISFSNVPAAASRTGSSRHCGA